MADSKEYEQRVVYAGLMRMTTDRNMVKAGYERWVNELSNNEFDVFEIVADIASFLGLENAERKVMMMAMHAASNKMVDQLDPVPGYISSVGGASASVDTSLDEPMSEQQTKEDVAPAPAASPHRAVTERYLQLVSQYVKRTDAESFRELAVIISDEGLDGIDKGLNGDIKNWGSSGLNRASLSEQITEDECQSIADALYVLLTEVIGPMDADSVVNDAITDTLSIDAASKFSPRNFI